MLVSIPTILDVDVVRGVRATEGAPLDLVFEIPHGATRTEDFTSLAAKLTSPLPDGLVDFFHVNTDAGAPELAVATARRFVEAEPQRTVAVLRCRIPRTFIDCNRRVDASAEDFKAGKVSPGLMPWITEPADRALLRAALDRYVAAVKEATALLASDGAMVLLHSYAPREVGVEVDLEIVKSLRTAYQTIEAWPLRPELDVIGKGLDGTSYAPKQVVDALRDALGGLTLADGATYPLHSSTMAWDHVMAHPGRSLCLEVRRDLLADPFEPFAQMTISAAKVERIATPLATALRRWW
ncbi:MAG: N-formylglutamate amidohydrolase [Deltaproteobacteria bacterium]|nr:N-formylglutamate amidohydrolase [Deltaproteobacteria bacterium]